MQPEAPCYSSPRKLVQKWAPSACGEPVRRRPRWACAVPSHLPLVVPRTHPTTGHGRDMDSHHIGKERGPARARGDRGLILGPGASRKAKGKESPSQVGPGTAKGHGFLSRRDSWLETHPPCRLQQIWPQAGSPSLVLARVGFCVTSVPSCALKPSLTNFSGQWSPPPLLKSPRRIFPCFFFAGT